MIDYSTRKLKRHYFKQLKNLWALENTYPSLFEKNKRYVERVKAELQRRSVWVP